MTLFSIAGCDFGARTAGTSVVAILHDDTISIRSSAKGEDADDFVLRVVEEHRVGVLGIDAPLSLPQVMHLPSAAQRCAIPKPDYQFRKADRETHAMSPMFLGGLSARAMALHDQLVARFGLRVYEVYPKLRAQALQLSALGYKEGKPALNLVSKVFQATGCVVPRLDTELRWHEVDALLALLITRDIVAGVARCFGDKNEGLIWA